jgi:hypothetical protein
MSLEQSKVSSALDALRTLLSDHLYKLVELAQTKPGADNPYHIDIPSGNNIDLAFEDLQHLVALTANHFGMCTESAARMRALCKILEADYKLKFKTSQTGSNAQQREASGLEASKTELQALALAESCCELAEAFEARARVASESARKLFDSHKNIRIASAREDLGQVRESSYSTHQHYSGSF